MSKPNVTVTLAQNGDVDIRLARNEDGPRIGELVSTLMKNVDLSFLDWSEVFPFWLVAELKGDIVGTIQDSLGKPMGRTEILAVDEKLPHRTKAAVVKELMSQGLATLQQAGSQVALGMVPFEMKTWKKVVTKRGGVIIFSGHTMLKRLQ